MAYSRARASRALLGIEGSRGTGALVAVLLGMVAACTSEETVANRLDAAASTSVHPPRVVALAPSLTEIVVALGGAGLLVARTEFDDDPAVAELPSVGQGLDPSLEALAGSGADLVLIPSVRDGDVLIGRLEELGIRGMAFPTQSVADIYRAVARLGTLLDRTVEADSLAAAVAGRLDAVRRRVDALEPVSVLYAVWSDPPMTTGPGTFIDEVIRIAGGRNVFDDAPMEWPTVGFESIVERDPKVILWPQGKSTAEEVQRLSDTPGWRDVPAVQADRIEVIDSDLFNRPGPRVTEAAETLARLLHPEAFRSEQTTSSNR
jgi:iron complex transport system substrate-binding protein